MLEVIVNYMDPSTVHITSDSKSKTCQGLGVSCLLSVIWQGD